MKTLGKIFWLFWILGAAFICLGKAAHGWELSGRVGSTYPFMWAFAVNWFVWGLIPFLTWKLINRGSK